MYLYFFISHANSKAFKYALSLIRQFNCEIIRTNQKVNARTLKADILTPACRDLCLLLCTEQAGEREAGSGPGFSLFKKKVDLLADAPRGFRHRLNPAAGASPAMR